MRPSLVAAKEARHFEIKQVYRLGSSQGEQSLRR